MGTNMEHIRKYEPLFGSWHADSFIGTDGVSRVYRIFREENGVKRYAALKFIPLAPKDGEKVPAGVFDYMVNGLKSRAALISNLRSDPHILAYDGQLIRPREDGGYDILLRTELMENLTGRISSGRLTETDAVKLGSDILSAVESAEKAGAMHGDIKPDNIFISSDGTYKLGDIGLSRCLERPDLHEKKKAGGYTAPEISLEGRYSPACDIYSIGVIMYRILNKGKLPFMPDSPVSSQADRKAAIDRRLSGEELPALPGVDDKLEAIVRKACAFKPEDRFASASEMKSALAEYEEFAMDGTTALLTGVLTPASAPSRSDPAPAAPPRPDPAPAAPPKSVNEAAAANAYYPAQANASGNRPVGNADRQTRAYAPDPVPVHIKEDAQPKKKKKTGLIVGLILGGAALLLLIALAVLLIVFLKGKNKKQEASEQPGSIPTTAPTQYNSPTDPPVVITPSPETTATPTPEPTEEPGVTFANEKFEAAFRKATGMKGKITEDDLYSITSLTMDECGLTDISDVAMFRNLKTLNLRKNNINDITPIAQLRGLEDLSLRGNLISDLRPLSGLTRLNSLGLSENYISDLTPIAGLSGLTELYLHDNNLTDISAISGLTRLQKLQIYNNSISDITPLRNMTMMTDLRANNNSIYSVEAVRNMTKLTTLKLNDNNISDISPLYNLTKLKVLTLGTNNISDLSPLWYMTELEELHLKRNNISDVWALSNLKNLKILSIYENNIGDISPLYGLTKLESLKIKSNPIPENQVAYIKALLPKCNVVF